MDLPTTLHVQPKDVLKELVNDWTAAQELEDLFVPPRQ
jgi:hypothetical protein